MNPSPTIKTYNFNPTRVATLLEEKEIDWPVVYQIFDNKNLYVGETTNLHDRMSQHLKNPEKSQLTNFSVIFDDTYNKSVALDLEAQLIQWFSGDGKYTLLNRNDGIASHKYYDCDKYKQNFTDIWELLRKSGLAKQSISDIQNSGLFKFSPYKSLTEDQTRVVYNVLENLDEAFKEQTKTLSVIEGKEGTGKTIVIMYLIKLIRDIQDSHKNDDIEPEQILDLFFRKPFKDRFKNKTIAVVIPNQSLKGSIGKIFKTISNLADGSVDVLSPIDFGSNGKKYDLTLVDEGHLLKRSNQEVHKANREKVDQITKSLFGNNKPRTELDWIIKKSRNVVMVYGDQRVRPNHITPKDVDEAINICNHQKRIYPLKTQMRSLGGKFYIDYLQSILSDNPPQEKQYFDNFEFKLYHDFNKFVNDVRAKNEEFGLSRLVAGFAWGWKSKKDKNANDIEIDGCGLKWNSTPNDWVGSPQSAEEVGSIYTIQGFDLNYVGVIIGNDLKYDPVQEKIVFSRKNYSDRGAKKRTKQQIAEAVELSDEELLDQVVRTYRILMNRSIKGTYVYVCDENLRNYLARYI